MKAKIDTNRKLFSLFKEKGLVVKENEEEKVVFASRMTNVDYYSIFCTLRNLKKFYEARVMYSCRAVDHGIVVIKNQAFIFHPSNP